MISVTSKWTTSLAATLRRMADELEKGNDQPADMRIVEHTVDGVYFGFTMVVCAGEPRDEEGQKLRSRIEKAIANLKG